MESPHLCFWVAPFLRHSTTELPVKSHCCKAWMTQALALGLSYKSKWMNTIFSQCRADCRSVRKFVPGIGASSSNMRLDQSRSFHFLEMRLLTLLAHAEFLNCWNGQCFESKIRLSNNRAPKAGIYVWGSVFCNSERMIWTLQVAFPKSFGWAHCSFQVPLPCALCVVVVPKILLFT